MNICGIEIDAATQAAVLSFALWCASELIGMSPLKDNSLIQMVLRLLTHRIPAPTEARQTASLEFTTSGTEGLVDRLRASSSARTTTGLTTVSN